MPKLQQKPPDFWGLLLCRSYDALDAIKGCWYIKSAALLQSGNRKEVLGMDVLSSILVAVAAGVLSHCICKWLDGHGKG